MNFNSDVSPVALERIKRMLTKANGQPRLYFVVDDVCGADSIAGVTAWLEANEAESL